MLLGVDQACQEEGQKPFHLILDICRPIFVSVTASSIVALNVICFLILRSIFLALSDKNFSSLQANSGT